MEDIPKTTDNDNITYDTPNPETTDQNNPFEDQSKNDYINSLKEAIFQKKTKSSEQVKNEYKFWDTQPVPKIKSEDTDELGPIESENDLEKERKEPLKLPLSYSWCDIDIHNDVDLKKVKIFKYFKFFYF